MGQGAAGPCPWCPSGAGGPGAWCQEGAGYAVRRGPGGGVLTHLEMLGTVVSGEEAGPRAPVLARSALIWSGPRWWPCSLVSLSSVSAMLGV